MQREALAKSVLTVHLMGGLGNQMFQYAFGRRLALANSADLILDATGYGTNAVPDRELGLRMCGLEHFQVVGRIVLTHSVGDERTPLRRWARKGRGFLERVVDARRPYFLRREITEPPSNYRQFDSRVKERSFQGRLGLRGFWQSEQYFLDIADLIREELRPSAQPTGMNAALAHRIQAGPSVAIHVRHGDNASSVAANLGMLPREYYEAALVQVRDVSRGPFFVFSDDTAWASEWLKPLGEFTVVEHNDPWHAHEDMRLMALCRHHVLANSTFGWWGAWLARHAGQIVIAPKRAYQNSERQQPDFYPSGWRLL